MTRYLTIFTGRCGVTWMTSMLKQHPDICARDEIIGMFNKKFTGSSGKTPAYTAVRAEEQWRLLYEGTTPEHGEKVAGFSLKLVHMLDRDGLRRFIEKENVLIIHGIRRNLVAQVVSFFGARAAQRQHGHFQIKKRQHRIGKVRLERREFMAALERRAAQVRQTDEFVSSLSAPAHILFYEELLTAPYLVMKNIFFLLGVHQKIKLNTQKFVKNMSPQLPKAVENYDELCQWLEGTDFAFYLELHDG